MRVAQPVVTAHLRFLEKKLGVRLFDRTGRTAGPAEQASVLVFLNSSAASYITGQVIWVDGGTIGDTDLAGSVTRR